MEVDVDVGRPWGVFQPWACEILLFVIDFKGVEHTSLRHTSSHRQGRIARIGANLYDSPWLVHLAEHGEQTSLERTTRHTRTNELRVRGAVELIEIGMRCCGVTRYVIVESFVDVGHEGEDFGWCQHRSSV